MKKKYLKIKSGFTIIETMISVALFIVIVVAGMGALLNSNLLHGKSQNMRSIMDNLSFVMEDMSRNLRTGYNYRCITNNNDLSSTNTLATPQSGQNCWGISFEWQNGTPYEYNSSGVLIDKHGEDQWVYSIDNSGKIWKSTQGATSGSFIQLTPDEVVITGNVAGVQISSFTVSGAPSGDKQQPFVTIKLVGKIIYKGVETPFSLQTSVSQRALDIWVNSLEKEIKHSR